MKKRIDVFKGIKVICILLIFYWHSEEIPKPGIDLGARVVEILFLISGFLSAYNYKSTNNSIIKDTLIVFVKKVKLFYPIHIITFLISFFVLGNRTNALTLLLNIALLQSWSNDINVYFSYNGLSWYLSSIIFCYCLVPLFMLVYNKINKKNEIKNDILIIAFVSIIRILIELLNDECDLGLCMHTLPIVRFMEFSLGMIMYFIFDKTKNTVNRKILFACELVMPIIAIVMCRQFNNFWPRSLFVLLFCPIILIYSYEKGPLSKVLSMRIFKLANNIQLEFYMLHHLVILITDNILKLNINSYLMFFINLITTLFLSIIFKLINNYLIKLSPIFTTK